MRGLHRIDTSDIGPEDPDTILDEEADAHEQKLLEEDCKLAVQRSFDRRAHLTPTGHSTNDHHSGRNQNPQIRTTSKS
jgi:hypothetical protein